MLLLIFSTMIIISHMSVSPKFYSGENLLLDKLFYHMFESTDTNIRVSIETIPYFEWKCLI